MTKADILDDLDYVKTLAEEGKNAPQLGGRIGIWWGLLLCMTLCIHYFALKGTGPLSIEMIGLAWLSFGIIGSLGSFILGRNMSKKPGASSMNNRVAKALWTGNTVFLFVYGLSAGINAALGRIDYIVMDTMLPIAFGLYGLTSFVLAQISGDKWQLIPGAIALSFVPISLFLLGKPEIYLAAIAAVICTILIPSLIHMRKEPQVIV